MTGRRIARGGRTLRIALAIAGVAAVALGLGYLLRAPVATATWPFPVTPITFSFLGAVAIAFGAPALWVAWTGDAAAAAGIALTVSVVLAIFAVAALTMLPSQPNLGAYVAIGVVIAIIGFAAFAVAARRAPLDVRPTPRHVRAIFVALSVVLVLTGGAMLVRVPNVLPWSVDLGSQQLIGALFAGDAAYFMYAVARPVWPHAAGALLAFLAYDVVLAIPLIDHISVVKEEHRIGLALYIAVVGSTAALAVYHLALDRSTRLDLRRPALGGNR